MEDLTHIEKGYHLPFKTADYISSSGEKIFNKLTKNKEKGFFGLPSAMEVS